MARTEYVTNKEMWQLLQDIAASGHTEPDPRLSYVEVQVDRDTWQRITAIFGTGAAHPQCENEHSRSEESE